MSGARDEARELVAQARQRHAEHDTGAAVELTRRALALDPENVEALEDLATALITRQHRHEEGLALIERATALREDDAGLWYALGWCYEFAAHETARRPVPGEMPGVTSLYERAAEGFRRCLALNPEGKLVGDAQDLLDHVENELRSRT
jgi:tetratricopeptide (TPR) repeat protein